QGSGGKSRTDQPVRGENATPLGTMIDAVWVDRAVAIMGATEGTLPRASQPSIIMRPDSAMPTGPSRTHVTRITKVARREPLMPCEYPARALRSHVPPRETITAQPFPTGGHLPGIQAASPPAGQTSESCPASLRAASP